MRHDKRGEDGMWRTRTTAESRAAGARRMTQEHSGPATHSREPRRSALAVCQYDAPMFKDGRVNRDGYHPKV